MCAILDTNTFGRFRNQKNQDLEPVRKWLKEKNGKIVYSNTKKFKSEWKKGVWNSGQRNAAGLVNSS